MPTMNDDSESMPFALPRLDGGDGPARPISSGQARDMVLRAMDIAMPAPRPRVLRRSGWLVALAAALVATAVAAGVLVAFEHTASVPTPANKTALTTAASTAPSHLPMTGLASPTTDTPTTPTTQAPTPSPIFTAGPPPVTPPAQVSAPADMPADLLKRANEARAHQQFDDALHLYDRVAKTASGSSRAVAMISEAQILLDHQHNIAGAKSLFSAVAQSSPGPALAEEAEYGLVECARASGDTAEEISLLHAFIDHHPDSFRVSAARTRLSSLEK